MNQIENIKFFSDTKFLLNNEHKSIGCLDLAIMNLRDQKISKCEVSSRKKVNEPLLKTFSHTLINALMLSCVLPSSRHRDSSADFTMIGRFTKSDIESSHKDARKLTLCMWSIRLNMIFLLNTRRRMQKWGILNQIGLTYYLAQEDDPLNVS